MDVRTRTTSLRPPRALPLSCEFGTGSAQLHMWFSQRKELQVQVACSKPLLCDTANLPCLGINPICTSNTRLIVSLAVSRGGFFLAVGCTSVEAMGLDGAFLCCLSCFVFTVEVTDQPDRSDPEFIGNRSRYVTFLNLGAVLPGKPILIRHP